MKRIDNLTGVRAVAALWVVTYHMAPDANSRVFGTFAHGGWMGVDIFYVLSGFVLSLVYIRKLPAKFDWSWYRSFLSRRVAKIYPLHILTFLFVAASWIVLRHFHDQFQTVSENTPKSALLNIFMLHSLGLTHNLGWNHPSWSVSAEWIAYSVLFAPMVFLLRRVQVVYVAALSIALWAALILTAALIFKVSISTLTTDGVLRIIPEFTGGYLLYRLLQSREERWGDFVTLIGIASVVVTAAFPRYCMWILLPGVMTLLAGLYMGGAVSDRVFGNRPMVLLGDASYSIYLMQAPFFTVSHYSIKRLHIAENLPVAVILTALAAVVGMLTFRFVEEPLRQRVLRLLEGKDRGNNVESLAKLPLPGLERDTQVSSTIG